MKASYALAPRSGNLKYFLIVFLFVVGSVAGSVSAAVPAPPQGSTATTQTFSNNPSAAIPDGPGGVSLQTLSVSTADTFLFDLDLVVDITHSFNSDLTISLISPSGTEVVISSRNATVEGGLQDVYVGTTFDDDAVDVDSTNLATDFAYIDSITATPLVPEGTMAGFIGEDPNGDWTLVISDAEAFDTGVLNSWSLVVSTLDVAPTSQFSSAISAPESDIPDGPDGSMTDTIPISGVGTYICDLNVLVDIRHSWSTDLDVFLISPAGTRITLTTDNGGAQGQVFGLSNVFAGTVFDDNDTAAGPVTDFDFTNNVTPPGLMPEGALGALIGEDPNGAWVLEVNDDEAFDTGTLIGWRLEMELCDGGLVEPGGPLIPVPVNNRLALLGLVALLLILGGVFAQSRRLNGYLKPRA